MRSLALLLAPALLAGIVPSSGVAQNQTRTDSAATSPPRDPTNTLPLATTRSVRFTASEGTWMSVDVSPGRLDDRLRSARRHLHRADRGRKGDAHHRRQLGRRAAALLARRQVARVHLRPQRRRRDLDRRRGRTRPAPAHATAAHYPGVDAGRSRRSSPATGWSMCAAARAFRSRRRQRRASFTGDGRYIWFQSGTQAARYDRERGTDRVAAPHLPGGVLRPMVSTRRQATRRTSRASRRRLRSWCAISIAAASGGSRWARSPRRTSRRRRSIPGPLPPGVTPPPPPPPPGVGPLPTSAWLPDEKRDRHVVRRQAVARRHSRPARRHADPVHCRCRAVARRAGARLARDRRFGRRARDPRAGALTRRHDASRSPRSARSG